MYLIFLLVMSMMIMVFQSPTTLMGTNMRLMATKPHMSMGGERRRRSMKVYS